MIVWSGSFYPPLYLHYLFMILNNQIFCFLLRIVFDFYHHNYSFFHFLMDFPVLHLGQYFYFLFHSFHLLHFPFSSPYFLKPSFLYQMIFTSSITLETVQPLNYLNLLIFLSLFLLFLALMIFYMTDFFRSLIFMIFLRDSLANLSMNFYSAI